MKKNNIIIAVAAVVLIAGIGTGIFFGIRNAKKPRKVKKQPCTLQIRLQQ